MKKKNDGQHVDVHVAPGAIYISHVENLYPAIKEDGKFEIGITKEDGCRKVPEELDTPEAHAIWERAKARGWVDEDLQPLLSQKKASVLAAMMGERLGLLPLWEPFERLWGVRMLRIAFSQSKLRQYYPGFRKAVEEIL